MASAIDIDAVKQKVREQIELQPAEGTDQVDQPLIVVINNNDPVGNGINGGNGQFTMFHGRKPVDPKHTKRKEFQQQSREACGVFCDFNTAFCSFSGVSSCLIIWFVIRGLWNMLIPGVLLNIPCNGDNIHDLDNVFGPDFPYSCNDFHTELYLQLFDGISSIIASLMALCGLIVLKPWLFIPVMVYGVIRCIYLLVLILMFSDFVNIGAIIGVLFSIGWSLVFYNTYKIVQSFISHICCLYTVSII